MRHVALVAFSAALSLACSPEADGDGGTGGAAGSGGGGWSTFCTVTRSSIGANDPTAFGFAAADLIPLAAGVHTAEVTWMTRVGVPAIPPSKLSLAVDTSALSVEYVTRTFIPGSQTYPEARCDNTLELTASASLSTADGKFDEVFQPFVLVYVTPEGGTAAPDHLHADVALEPAELHGSFAPSYDPGWCFYGVGISIDFRPKLFVGSIVPSFLSPPCDPNARNSALASGPESGTWSSVTN